jgi:hypothetical protein
LSDRNRLSATELTQTEARKVPVDDPLRILDVGMPHQQHARGHPFNVARIRV